MADKKSKEQSMNKLFDNKGSPIWAVITVVFTLAIIICSGIIIYSSRLLSIENDQFKLNTEELNKDVEIYDKGLEKSSDEYSEKALKEILPVSQINAMAKTFWSYELDVNGIKVETNDISVKNPVKISLKQIEKERVLPLNLHNKGAVTAGDPADRFYEHIILPTVNYSLTPPLSNVNPSVATVDVTGVKAGDKFVLSVTPILKERLPFPKTDVNITVK
jgi:hypothetical protein